MKPQMSVVSKSQLVMLGVPVAVVGPGETPTFIMCAGNKKKNTWMMGVLVAVVGPGKTQTFIMCAGNKKKHSNVGGCGCSGWTWKDTDFYNACRQQDTNIRMLEAPVAVVHGMAVLWKHFPKL